MNDELAKKLKELPSSSGVYIMYDKDRTVIYVGKAVVLKKRVRQYFHNSVKEEKVMRMTEKVVDFSYILTKTEADAFALENNLIKKHQPQYNILLKDDKAKPYIKINLKDEYPSVEITRKVKNDGAKYFGPYYGGVRVRDLVELIKSAYPIRTCNLNLSKVKKGHRECLNYHMGLCAAPCTGRVSAAEYRGIMEKVVDFLNGKDDAIETTLKEKMAAAAEREEFETALRCRDQLAILDKMKTKVVTTLPRDMNMDVAAYATNGAYSVISVLSVRGGKMLGCENFPIIDATFSESQAVSAFLTQYYDGSVKAPPEVVLGHEPEDGAVLSRWLTERSLSGNKVNVLVPKMGVRKQLLDTARNNAEDYLEKSVDEIRRKEEFTIGAVYQLQNYLGLEKAPVRIECYDISNIGGVDKVASMVVFVNGTASKKDYRRFKIRTVEGIDDFASMKEVLSRRLAHDREKDTRFALPPDLIVIDGGKGQLSSAQEAMKALGLDYQMIGLAKREEEVFLPGRSEPVILPRNSNALKLLQRVRDEAHRFAITYHRKLRTKRFEGQFKKIGKITKQS